MISKNGQKTWGTYWTHRDDPVLEVDVSHMTEYPNGDRLPGIWVTEPIFDGEGGYDGRTYMMFYPYTGHDFPFPGGDDEDGSDALYYGGCYYDEAMGYTSPEDHQKRVDCFRAAEIFYRHSAGRGNPVACLCLGYVYGYDRCEGDYWPLPATPGAGYGPGQPFPREERAFECLEIAAAADIPEACYKLGDMYKHGTGCEGNAHEAFSWYARASELALRERPAVLGSIALRLAGCYEEGFGCGQDFSRALEWYGKAARALEVAVDAGDSWYAKALAGARAGVKRCRQELS